MVLCPPPLGRQDSRICIELYTKVRHASPPLCYLDTKFELTNGQNVGEDCFFAKNRTKFE